MADAALEAAAKVGSPVFNPGDDETKKLSDEVAEAFRGFAQTATEEQLMHAAAEGFAAPVLYQAIEDQAATIAGLRQRLEASDRARRVPTFPYSPPAASPAPAGPPPNVVSADVNDPMKMARDAAGGLLRDFANMSSPGAQ